MIWSETPPTKSGWYWVKRWNETLMPAEVRQGNTGLILLVGYSTPWLLEPGIEKYYTFGPPIPSPEQCAEIEEQAQREAAAVELMDRQESQRLAMEAKHERGDA